MDQEKIGKFIVQLRKERKLTQDELAAKIPISRQAVSKWERGKTIPDPQTLLCLSEIFDVTINELLYGERKNKKNEEKIENITLDLYKSNTTKKNIIKWLLFILVFAIVTFLLYYFITLYNSIKIFRVNYYDENVEISNGLFVLTRENIYFQLGKVDCLKDKAIQKLNLYYKLNDNKEFVCETYDSTMNFADYYGYNQFFGYYNFEEIIDNLYLDIYLTNGELLNIKLNVIEDYRNNKLFFPKKTNTVSDKEQNNNYWDENLSKNKFTIEKLEKIYYQVEGGYCFEGQIGKRDVRSLYDKESHILVLDIYENDLIVDEWYYNFQLNHLSYQNYVDKQLNYSISNYKGENQCDFGVCNGYEKINEFYEIMNEIFKGN